MMKTAVMYLRRSTNRQEQSIGDQREAIERYAEQNDYEIVNEYVDDAISGTDTKSRKAFLKLIEDAQNGRRFAFILCYDVSRFGRVETDEAGHYRYLLSKAGVEVLYVAEGFHGDDSDDILRSVKQVMAFQSVVALSKAKTWARYCVTWNPKTSYVTG